MSTLFASDAVVGYAQVAVERGVDRFPAGLTYAIPKHLADLAPGERVIVPLGRGNRGTAGYVVEIRPTTELEADAVKPITRRDHASVRLPGQLLDLARWISSYYCTPVGMTLATILPAAVKRNIGAVRKVYIDLGEPLPLEQKLPPKQRDVLRTLAAVPAEQRPVEIRELAERAGAKTTGPIKQLLEKKLLEATRRTSVEAAWIEHAVDAFAPAALSPAQQAIVDAVGAALDAGFSSHLLYGVTGSGKTEVYIRLIRRVVEAGRTAILLVPEISLTPQTGGRLIGRFPDQRVAVLHSGLTAAQRHQQWALAADGRARIVLGARSAVFAPIPDGALGLVIVDEEHDASYKQDQAPRYHGRDVAIRRAQMAGCPVVLGSATPSLESWHNATERRAYALHRLDERVPGMRLPKVTVVDFREQQRQHRDRRVHLIGPVLQAALDRTLRARRQALILLNRRGYANYIACPDHRCGWLMTCDHCDVTMVYHVSRDLPTGGYVQCHHCLSEQKLPVACPDCGRKVTTFGLGTQRVEEELSLMFPSLVPGETMWRVDSDSMHVSRDFHQLLERFGSGEIAVLVGTQMIAKGLDYPGVRLVGVINADTAINLPDFRASERTFQLVSQVAGRSGRSSEMGEVVVQTFNPTAPAIRLAASHEYERFAAQELAERRRSGLPPLTRMARIVVRDADYVRCVSEARTLAEGLRRLAGASLRILGPMPCPLARLADRHRHQVELFAPNAADLQAFLTAARNAGLIRSGAMMAIDVDPTALL